MGFSQSKPKTTPEVEQLIDKIIQSNLNITFVPDETERIMYTRLIMMLLNVLSDALNTLKIDIMGYSVEIQVTKKV
jgi:hypothetical protein